MTSCDVAAWEISHMGGITVCYTYITGDLFCSYEKFPALPRNTLSRHLTIFPSQQKQNFKIYKTSGFREYYTGPVSPYMGNFPLCHVTCCHGTSLGFHENKNKFLKDIKLGVFANTIGVHLKSHMGNFPTIWEISPLKSEPFQILILQYQLYILPKS